MVRCVPLHRLMHVDPVDRALLRAGDDEGLKAVQGHGLCHQGVLHEALQEQEHPAHVH